MDIPIKFEVKIGEMERVIRAVGDLVEKLGRLVAAGVVEIGERGAEKYDVWRSNSERERLFLLYTTLLHYWHGTNEGAFEGLSAHVEQYDPDKPLPFDPPSWIEVSNHVQSAAQKVEALLSELQGNALVRRLVLDDSYKTILAALEGRKRFFAHLRKLLDDSGHVQTDEMSAAVEGDVFSQAGILKAPPSPEVMEALRRAVAEFQALRNALRQGATELRAFVEDAEFRPLTVRERERRAGSI